MFKILPWKRCAKCGAVKPATREHFRFASRFKSLCSSRCRACPRADTPHVDQLRLFWSKIDKAGPILIPELGPCWLWNGAKTRKGYGWFTQLPGTSRAHRIAWEACHGPVPPTLRVLHRCDNPPCCNPAHLFVGTDAVNNRDRSAKGRWKGGAPPGTKRRLTGAEVARIRELADGGEPKVRLARAFGVHEHTIRQIVFRRSHVG